MDLPDHEKLDRLNRLIIFTRYPELGKNKTRLIPALEDVLLRSQAEAKATDIHRRLAEHTLAQSRQWFTSQAIEMASETLSEVAQEIDKTSGKITVCFTGGDAELMAVWLGEDLDYHSQGEGDLGQRILVVLQHFRESNLALENYFVIIGTDCPELASKDIDRAFQALSKNDLVIGQAEDGGYYLIGFKQIIPSLFQGISWGTATVFAETLAIANSLGLRISYLPVLRDIDRPEDLDYLITLAGFENI
jgi:uncharacterized protein